MKTIKLNVSDNIYSHIMFFLKSLKSDELEIIEENKKEESSNNTKKELDKLNLLFSKSKNSIKVTKELAINSEEMIHDLSLYEFAFICKKLEEELEVINDNIDFLSRYIKNKLVTFDKGFKNFIKSSKTNIEIIQ